MEGPERHFIEDEAVIEILSPDSFYAHPDYPMNYYVS
jgi:hypothetical protein